MLEMFECLMYNSITCQKVGLKIQIGFFALSSLHRSRVQKIRSPFFRKFKLALLAGSVGWKEHPENAAVKGREKSCAPRFIPFLLSMI